MEKGRDYGKKGQGAYISIPFCKKKNCGLNLSQTLLQPTYLTVGTTKARTLKEQHGQPVSNTFYVLFQMFLSEKENFGTFQRLQILIFWIESRKELQADAVVWLKSSSESSENMSDDTGCKQKIGKPKLDRNSLQAKKICSIERVKKKSKAGEGNQ